MLQLLLTLLSMAVVAGPAHAVLVTFGGNYTGTAGSATVADLNTVSRFDFAQTFVDASVSGTVVVESVPTSQAPHQFRLSLTNFSFATAASQPRTLSVRLVQDFALPASFTIITATQQAAGNYNLTAAGQSATVLATSRHEVVNLPALFHTVNSVQNSGVFNWQTASTIPERVFVSGPVYTIDTQFTFTIDAQRSAASINLPVGGASTAVFVPSPGVACMAFVAGFAMIIRRRDGK